jgi:hypothetical protein
MKKLIQFFALVVVLSTSQLAQAGTYKSIKNPGAETGDSITVRTNFAGVIHPDIGGEVIIVITVLDITETPIKGALVSIPCTGLANQLTNALGQATFNLGTVCTCSNDNCTVTTKSCYQQIKVSCGNYNVTCP